jgi:branched-chain amino acid transport system ATP-binding protein
VGAAEIVSLIGANGAGKTTLLNVISGLHPTRNGSRMFCDIETRGLKAEKIVALGLVQVPEADKVFNPLTVLENLELGAFTRKARETRDQMMQQVFGVFPILKARNTQMAGTLSGGEQQMLAIARALMSRPRLLLVDELSWGLAPVAIRNITETLKQINKAMGLTIFIVEQNVSMTLEMADYGYIIENGRIVGQGTAKELLESDQVRDAYLRIGEI